MEDAARNFPDDLAWKVTYDPTTFVTATIHEVQKTLIEAFILVVLVVYLFLGNLRATLIPTIAVPVSLIGTFVVLNAIGYSANTVSLLAVVLAIGIVVDDAIVVVEAVEQVMEHHPELSPGEATKLAMGRSSRRSSGSRWCCCRCSFRWPSFLASPVNYSASSRSLSPFPCYSRRSMHSHCRLLCARSC